MLRCLSSWQSNGLPLHPPGFTTAMFALFVTHHSIPAALFLLGFYPPKQHPTIEENTKWIDHRPLRSAVVSKISLFLGWIWVKTGLVYPLLHILYYSVCLCGLLNIWPAHWKAIHVKRVTNMRDNSHWLSPKGKPQLTWTIALSKTAPRFWIIQMHCGDITYY